MADSLNLQWPNQESVVGRGGCGNGALGNRRDLFMASSFYLNLHVLLVANPKN